MCESVVWLAKVGDVELPAGAKDAEYLFERLPFIFGSQAGTILERFFSHLAAWRFHLFPL